MLEAHQMLWRRRAGSSRLRAMVCQLVAIISM